MLRICFAVRSVFSLRFRLASHQAHQASASLYPPQEALGYGSSRVQIPPSTTTTPKKKPPEWVVTFLAEKEGFEPSLRYTRTTPLAGAPLRPLGYFSKPKILAEREGFEPTVPCGITSFQD